MGILAPTAPIILVLHVWGGMRTTIPLQHFTAEMAETVKFMFSKVADMGLVCTELPIFYSKSNLHVRQLCLYCWMGNVPFLCFMFRGMEFTSPSIKHPIQS